MRERNVIAKKVLCIFWGQPCISTLCVVCDYVTGQFRLSVFSCIDNMYVTLCALINVSMHYVLLVLKTYRPVTYILPCKLDSFLYVILLQI